MKKKNKGGRPSTHDSGLKVAVAREYLTGNLSLRELDLKYHLQPGQANNMVQWYRKRYAAATESAEQPQEAVTQLQLLKELKDANLKIEALEIMIEIARKELGIDILKKPGIQQS
jgi:hypothetical protein